MYWPGRLERDSKAINPFLVLVKSWTPFLFSSFVFWIAASGSAITEWLFPPVLWACSQRGSYKCYHEQSNSDRVVLSHIAKAWNFINQVVIKTQHQKYVMFSIFAVLFSPKHVYWQPVDGLKVEEIFLHLRKPLKEKGLHIMYCSFSTFPSSM